MNMQGSGTHEPLDICRQCKEHGYYVWNGEVHMNGSKRFMLFILSAMCTVIIPAVMVSLFHTLTITTTEGKTFVAVMGMIPLALVLIVCFGGLYFSIFKIKPCERHLCPRR